MPELVNVPDVDGVPAVLFAPGAGGDIILAAADALETSLLSGGLGPQWGLYRSGAPAVLADNVAAFDYKEDWAISDYPLERGAFESFNKVKIPFDVRLVFTAGGSEARRAALLASLQAIVGDLNFYEAVTPERVYPSINLIHLDYRRSAQNGAGLLVVNVFCQEVRQTTSSGSGGPNAPGNTAEASGANAINGGTVQSEDAGREGLRPGPGQGLSGGSSSTGLGDFSPVTGPVIT